MNQQDWVEGCYAYYAENGYEPGNPEDGEWHEAHYPVPKCKGGEATVLLLKQHHAVQGVLQSEEFQHPCVWSWEGTYLTGDLLKLYKKWRSHLSRSNALASLDKLTPEERCELGRRLVNSKMASTTHEERSQAARRANAVQTPEQRRERQLRAAAAQTPEQRSEKIRKGWETRRRKAAEAQLLRDVTEH